MPKRYEEEIRELLRGMDDFPPPRRRHRLSWRGPGLTLRTLDPQRLVGGGLILILLGWVLSETYRWGIGLYGLARLGSYASLAGILVILAALLLSFSRSSLRRGPAFGRSREVRWRGQPISLPRRSGPLSSLRRWLRRLTSGRSPNRPGGRDSLQW